MSTGLAKLMISVMMVSDTGSVATTSVATDFPAVQCDQLVKDFNDKKSLEVQGHTVTIMVKSICVPILGSFSGRMPPPDITGIVEQLVNGFAPRER